MISLKELLRICTDRELIEFIFVFSSMAGDQLVHVSSLRRVIPTGISKEEVEERGNSILMSDENLREMK